MKPCVERILRERYIPKANRSWAHAQYAEHKLFRSLPLLGIPLVVWERV
jgi:hypothetical protein